jgi:hypothetical protein
MIDRLNWQAYKHGFNKQDCALAENMARTARDQIMIYADEKAIKPREAKTYRLDWNQLLQYYLKHQDEVLPHVCEFEHDNCAAEPNGYCVMLSGTLSHAMYAESAVLAALHDEWMQELLGHKTINHFFHRLKKFDVKFMPDLNKALLDAGYVHDVVQQYDEQGWDYVDSWVRLRGPCPIVRAKPEEMPDPPCPFE